MNVCYKQYSYLYINNISNSPYIFDSILSRDQPNGYENSDLKNIYISRQQQESVLHAPRIHIESSE